MAACAQLALIPLVAFSFAILRLFDAHRALEPLIYEFFRPMGDGSAELTRKVMDFADHVRGGLVGSVGMARITAANSSVQLLSQLPLLAELRRLALALTPYAIISAGMSLVYALIPNTRVRPAAALVGGLAAGVLWTAVGGLFATIVVYSSRLTIVYAGFAIFVAALIWTYAGWLILLLGAQKLEAWVVNSG